MNEILVRAMRVDEGPVIKAGGCFNRKVWYVLADGREISSFIASKKLKELPDDIKRREESIAAQACAFSFHDGKLGLLTESYTTNFGPGPSLVPEPRTDAVGYIAPATAATHEAT